MPDFDPDQFHTPPKVTPLNLDCISLDGGGWAPSQFEGKTQEGYNIYCRYRGGYLSVEISNEPGGDPLNNGHLILVAGLGPKLHGAMSLGQLCSIAGITINGMQPPMPSLPEMRKNGWLDLSGASSFYDFYMECTVETAKHAATIAHNILEEAYFVETIRNNDHQIIGAVLRNTAAEFETSDPTIIFGVKPSASKLAKVSQNVWLDDLYSNSLVVDLSCIGFQYPPPTFARSHYIDKRLENVGRSIKIAGYDNECLHQTLWMRATFPTDDVDKRSTLQQITDKLVALRPGIKIQATDLETGERLPSFDKTERVDPKIVEWALSDVENWLRVRVESVNEQNIIVGYRPSI